MMTKKLIETSVYDLLGELDGPIEKAIEHLQQLIGQGYSRIDTRDRLYDDGYTIVAVLEREETDNEYAGRLHEERLANERRLDWERQQFAMLAKKFGKEIV